MTTAARWPPLWLQILVGLVLGGALGVLIGPDAAPLGDIGKLVIQLIKVLATPLLFFSIVNAILHTEVSGKAGLRMVVIALVNASLALGLGLLASNLFEPGNHLQLHGDEAKAAVTAVKPIDFMSTLVSYVPSSVVQPFADNAIIPIVIFAILLGVALRRIKAELLGTQRFDSVSDFLYVCLRAAEIILGWIVRLIPLAVFAVVARSVGEYGFRPLAGLSWYVAVGVGGLLVHVLVTYQLWLVLVVKMPLGRFWRVAKDPVVYALGANSSLATLPVTLSALDRLGVSRSSSTLGACVGTNLNNDGIILYEAMAVLFVAQAHGIHLDAGQQLLAVASCMIAAMGIAGVPEAGFISLALVLATVGLPAELLPILLTVDWIIARGRSAVNVLSDMLVSIILDRWSGQRFDKLNPP